MESKWIYYISCLYLISCYTNLCFTFSILPPAEPPTANNTNDLDKFNSSLEIDHVNGTTQTGPLIINESTTADVPPHRFNVSDLRLKHKDTYGSPDSNVNGNPGIDLLDEDEDLPAAPNLTSTGNQTRLLNLYNSTHYSIWHHLMSFPSYVICQFYTGNDNLQKDQRVKTYLAGHKLLAMFLGMAGVLACLLILVYCIYIRQHKEEMFSHHRLYGEGFEDPVLRLDTPVDHLDFFSFRDTELTPGPTPQHKCYTTDTYETKGDDKVEAPKNTSSHEHLHQIIQMGSIRLS